MDNCGPMPGELVLSSRISITFGSVVYVYCYTTEYITRDTLPQTCSCVRCSKRMYNFDAVRVFMIANFRHQYLHYHKHVYFDIKNLGFIDLVKGCRGMRDYLSNKEAINLAVDYATFLSKVALYFAAVHNEQLQGRFTYYASPKEAFAFVNFVFECLFGAHHDIYRGTKRRFRSRAAYIQFAKCLEDEFPSSKDIMALDCPKIETTKLTLMECSYEKC